MTTEETNQNEQDEGSHKSGVDHANDLLNKARDVRSAYRGIKNANKFLKTAKTVRAGAVGIQAAGAVVEGAVATAPIWGTAAIVILIALIIATTFIIILGGGNVKAGTPPLTCASIQGTCQAAGSACASPNVLDTSGATCTTTTDICCAPPPSTGVSCNPSNPALSLKQDYNIVVAGATQPQLLEICNILSIPAKSSTYKNFLINSGPTNISLDAATGCGGGCPHEEP